MPSEPLKRHWRKCRLKSDAPECGILSESRLFALSTGISIKHGINKNQPETIFYWKKGPDQRVEIESPFGINGLIWISILTGVCNKTSLENSVDTDQMPPNRITMSQKTCAIIENSGQPAHSRSLIRVFADRVCVLQPPSYPQRDKREPLPGECTGWSESLLVTQVLL